MQRTAAQLREDIVAIWKVGVEGVKPERLMREAVSLDWKAENLTIGNVEYSLENIERIVVVGGGKASGAMAEALEQILRPLDGKKQIIGWVNVPDDCAKSLHWIKLHPARPTGINEPTEAAVMGTTQIIRLLEGLTPRDLCLNLLSGGGSALLVAPIPEVSLQDQRELIRLMNEIGLTIAQINTVRKQVCQIKGGGMKRLCLGKQLISLILSDVLGDPLDVIASGPTVDTVGTIDDAIEILREFETRAYDFAPVFRKTIQFLEDKTRESPAVSIVARPEDDENEMVFDSQGGFVQNIIIGNNARAVEAAGEEALRRGYTYALLSSRQPEGLVENVAHHIVELGMAMLKSSQDFLMPDCLIYGGEPVVRLVPELRRGKGGRNQQLVLAALVELLERPDFFESNANHCISLLSGGTDGEDGPTDAAGAWIDPMFFTDFSDKNQDGEKIIPRVFLAQNNAYAFFEPFETLLKTGATGTNVCDLRVVLVSRVANIEN